MARPRISEGGFAVRRNVSLDPELSSEIDAYLNGKENKFSELCRLALGRFLLLESNPGSQIGQQKRELEAARVEEAEIVKRLGEIKQRKQELSAQILEGERLLTAEKERKEKEAAEAAELEKLNAECKNYPIKQQQDALERVRAKHKPEERRLPIDIMRFVVQELKSQGTEEVKS